MVQPDLTRFLTKKFLRVHDVINRLNVIKTIPARSWIYLAIALMYAHIDMQLAASASCIKHRAHITAGDAADIHGTGTLHLRHWYAR